MFDSHGSNLSGFFNGQVYSGVAFSAHDSYVKLIPRNEFNTIEKVEIVFSSYDDSGILMMGLRQFTSVNIHLSFTKQFLLKGHIQAYNFEF